MSVRDRDPSRSAAARARASRGATTPTRPVQRSSLREQVAGALREEMMAGRLPAGMHFTVKEIADLYGVSATPVREALLDLAAQDLLWIEHNRGFTVPQLGWSEYLEVVEARTLVTEGILRRLRSHPEKIDWSRMASLHRRADAAARAARSGQLDVLVGCDRRFWSELAGLMGNRRLADYLDWLRIQYWIYAAPHLRGRTDIAAFCWSGHLELTQLILSKDHRGVRRMLLAYNQESLEQLAALCGEVLEPEDGATDLLHAEQERAPRGTAPRETAPRETAPRPEPGAAAPGVPAQWSPSGCNAS